MQRNSAKNLRRSQVRWNRLAALERLEPRNLLTLAHRLDGGDFILTGSADVEHITKIYGNAAGFIVYDHLDAAANTITVTTMIAAANVKAVTINVLGANDTVDLTTSFQGVPPLDSITVQGDSGEDTLMAPPIGETIDAGEITLKGEGDDDALIGNTDNDYLVGGPGEDTILGGPELDVIEGGEDRDYLFGEEGDDWIYGNGGSDFIRGNADNDYLYGNEDNDDLSGGDGKDYLYGGLDNDSFDGGLGSDHTFSNIDPLAPDQPYIGIGGVPGSNDMRGSGGADCDWEDGNWDLDLGCGQLIGTSPDESYAAGSNRDDYLEVLPRGVLDNDYNVDVATLVPNSGPFHGTLTFNSDGSFYYAADPGFSGIDTFQYTGFNNYYEFETPPETVTITVTYMAPTATDDEYPLDTDSEPSLIVAAPGVLMNESYADTAVLVPNSGPSFGTVSLNADGSFVYTPYAPFNGDDTFQYKAKDSYTGYESQPATVTIHVSCVWCSPLLLDRPAIEDSSAEAVTIEDVGPLGREAVRRWREAGVDRETLDGRLIGLQFLVLDLPGEQLAMADERTGTVVIDVNGAGYGWFLDTTPREDSEFALLVSRSERRADAGSLAAGKVDLLTVLEHEIGHLLGLEHATVTASGNIMEATLGLGTRRLPTALDAAAADYLYSIWQAERRRQAG